MQHSTNPVSCDACPNRVLCHCLNVTEEMIDALIALDRTNYNQVREATGAGDGCMACRKRVKDYLARRSLDVLAPASA
ncbi:MAG: (2Fe-2S)-binding protein [Gemmataceae bacterium]